MSLSFFFFLLQGLKEPGEGSMGGERKHTALSSCPSVQQEGTGLLAAPKGTKQEAAI